MMDVRVLASSSAGNAYVLTDSGHTLLLDAGIRYPDLQRALAHRVSSLDGCLLTHEHIDHARAVPQLLRAGVDVFASRGTLDALRISGHRAHVVRDQEPISIGAWRVLPLQAVHDAAEPLSFLIGGPTGKCLFVTDSAYCPYRFTGLTHVLLEANFSGEILRRNVESGRLDVHQAARVQRNHMSLARALDLLKANDLSSLQETILIHLSGSNSHAEDFAHAVRRATGRPVRIAAECAL
jgi:phosphoribosyl 1,2-cyclic phosphodiesterase